MPTRSYFWYLEYYISANDVWYIEKQCVLSWFSSIFLLHRLYIYFCNAYNGNRTKLDASCIFFRSPAPKHYFPVPGPFKTGRGRVWMHLGCFCLRQVCMWQCVKPLYYRWDPNILIFHNFRASQPFRENIFSQGASKTKRMFVWWNFNKLALSFVEGSM